MEKGRDRSGSYFLGLKIRGDGDEDAPLFVTGLFDTTSNTGSVMDTVMDTVTDSVTDETTGGDECDGCDSKTYNLLNLESQLARVEQYTTGLERELGEKAHRPLGGNLRVRTEQEETLAQNPSRSSQEQAQSADSDRLQVNSPTTKEPSQSVKNDENQGLKVDSSKICR